ncbi:type II toxin-antitoxin system VapC family toxin [Candidatus Gottesmanbacteria bacterium]|nr:type II toxin-antitoxin system VapC family toxin [Candidatus Gottesmanbacteria bacterium]
MYLLDSDIVIWLLRKDQKVTKATKQLAKKDILGVSTITVAEVYKNAFQQEFFDIEELFSKNIPVDVNTEIARLAGKYWKEFHPKLEKLSLSDTIIAATARFYDATLVTLNTRHFPMTDIKIINPLSGNMIY